jgi:UDPglucose 6-dehydrogenase
MKITIVGAGRVGLIVGTCFAENGHQVVCIGRDEATLERLSRAELPYHEPGLEELVARNLEEERLTFTTDLAGTVADSLLIFLCQGVAEGEDQTADLEPLLESVREIAKAMTGYRIIVNKNTSPVGTCDQIHEAVASLTSHPFDVVANPEFLKEGAAVDDFMRPDRVIVGTDEVRVQEIMREVYAPFLRTGKPFLVMEQRSAELAKLANDTMLGARVTLMNEIANVAEAYGADITSVQSVLMADSRLGSTYLFPGLGIGGAWLPQAPVAVGDMARAKELPSGILDGVVSTNRWQQDAFVKRITDFYGDDIKETTIAVWGASFKPRTDDIRNAPALRVIDGLLEAGAGVCAYDPVAGPKLTKRYGDRIDIAPKMYPCLEDADGLVIATEWREFHFPDFERMAGLMRRQVVFDGRNLYNPKTIADAGFTYHSIGRPPVG